MMKIVHAPKKTPLPGRLWILLRKPMVSGLLVVVPVGITVFVLKLLYDFTAGQLAPIVRTYVDPIPDHTSPIVAIFLLLVMVYFVGMITAAVVGRKLIALVERIIQSIPFVKSVYGASKQIVQALYFKNKPAEPKTPAIVEFPRPGMKSIGFVLGKVHFHDGRLFYRVFIPTTPNITVGLLQLMAPEDVYKCELSIDEAVKIVVSGGLLGPDEMTLTPASQAPLEPATVQDDDWDDWDDDEDD
ncbi:MAG: DUF502 domain-containing protein [Candidatus Hydrogenedentes bacterium]|jgi:uncharacterized membrane protein|nr:DUF502 domain-containing protein [Candidatus Hydrogenedentota bacterium]